MNQLCARYSKFCIVGASGVAVDMLAIALLASFLGWNLTLSKIIAAELAIINNFVWNETWTFKAAKGPGRLACLVRLAKFNLICATGILLSVVLLNTQVFILGMNIYLANFIAIGITSVWNFWMSVKFGWKLASKPPVGILSASNISAT